MTLTRKISKLNTKIKDFKKPNKFISVNAKKSILVSLHFTFTLETNIKSNSPLKSMIKSVKLNKKTVKLIQPTFWFNNKKFNKKNMIHTTARKLKNQAKTNPWEHSRHMLKINATLIRKISNWTKIALWPQMTMLLVFSK